MKRETVINISPLRASCYAVALVTYRGTIPASDDKPNVRLSVHVHALQAPDGGDVAEDDDGDESDGGVFYWW